MAVAALPETGPDVEREGHGEADVLDDLGDEIARLTALVRAATRRYLELVAEFDRRREGWGRGDPGSGRLLRERGRGGGRRRFI